MADRPPLTRDRIVDAAIGVADAEGIDALSMRRLAGALGYEPMSLYNHVENKDDLLAAMVDRVAGEMVAPEEVHWRTALRGVLFASRDALLAHPWAASLWNNAWPGPCRKRWMDRVLGCFRDAGFSVELTHHGFHAVDLFVVGVVQQRLSFSMPDDPEEAAAAFLGETPAAEYPHLVEHVQFHLVHDDLADDGFSEVLDFILDGLERQAELEVGA